MTWHIQPASNFAAYADRWDALSARRSAPAFLTSPFLLPALQQFGSGREIVVLNDNGDQLAFGAILSPVGRCMWQTFQPSQLPLGAWLGTGDAELVPSAQQLVSRLPGFALGVGLTQLDPLFDPRPAGGGQVGTLDYISTSHVEIAGSFDDYWAARGKNLRQNTKKQRNKLAADGVTPALECISDAAGVADALRDYGALESRGWKAGGGTDIRPDNAQGRFYGAMLEAFCARGRGRIYRYRFGDQVVAMDLCIDDGSTVVVLKTAYDETFKSVSPSTLMRQEQFQAWWQEGCFRRIEFYGKTLEWHTRWTESHRVLYHATVYRWPVLRSLHDHIRRWRPSVQQTADDAAPSEGKPDTQTVG